MGPRGDQRRSPSRRSLLVAAACVVFYARASEARGKWTIRTTVDRKNHWTMPRRIARIRGGGGGGNANGGSCPNSDGTEGEHNARTSSDQHSAEPPPDARIPPSNPRMLPTNPSEQQQWGDPSRNGWGSDTPLVASTAPLLPKELPAGPVNPSSRSVPVLRLTSEGVAVETTLSRQQLATELNCPLRDLRVADPTFPGQFPSVLARCGSIIFSVAEVKAVIRAHELLLFPTTPDVLSIVPAVQEKIQLLGIKGVVPFEQTAMECCLKHVCKTLLDSARNVEPRLRAVLGSFKTSKNSRIKSLHRLLPLKNELDELQETVVMVCKSMNDVLLNDEDMALMYLTENDKATCARDPEEHQEIEMLFENYLLQVELLASEIREYQNEVRNTEEIVEIELDVLRNNILRFELLLSISGFMVTFGALVTGVFGMNLLSGWEEKPHAFWGVTGGIYGLIVLSIAGTVALCRRLSLL